MEQITVKILRENAIIPKRATKGSAGYDLHACITEEILLLPRETIKIPTGLAIAIKEPFCVGLIYPRSGMSTKYNVSLPNAVGVIDSDYRGEILVGLTNYADKVFRIEPNQRIAQIIFTPVFLPEWKISDELDETERGEGGYGSSGK